MLTGGDGLRGEEQDSAAEEKEITRVEGLLPLPAVLSLAVHSPALSARRAEKSACPE